MKILKFSSLLQTCMQGNTHWWLSQQETGKQFDDYPTISLEFFPPAHQSQRFVFLCGFYKTFFSFLSPRIFSLVMTMMMLIHHAQLLENNN